MIPPKLTIPSAGEVIEFVNMETKNKITLLNYKYIEGKEKIGMLLPLTQIQLDKMIKDNIAVIHN